MLVGFDWRWWLLGLALKPILRRLQPPSTQPVEWNIGPVTFLLGAVVYALALVALWTRGEPLRKAAEVQ